MPALALWSVVYTIYTYGGVCEDIGRGEWDLIRSTPRRARNTFIPRTTGRVIGPKCARRCVRVARGNKFCLNGALIAAPYVVYDASPPPFFYPAAMLAWTDALLILVAVCFSLAFPRMPHAVRCHPVAKVAILGFVVLLCHCAPPYGVALALLLVLSSVPCLQPALKVRARARRRPAVDLPTRGGLRVGPASQSLARMQAQDIANKMDIFTQINRKRDKFKREMAGIQKDLAGVKEFYVNAAKSDPRRGKRGRKGGKK